MAGSDYQISLIYGSPLRISSSGAEFEGLAGTGFQSVRIDWPTLVGQPAKVLLGDVAPAL